MNFGAKEGQGIVMKSQFFPDPNFFELDQIYFGLVEEQDINLDFFWKITEAQNNKHWKIGG